MPPSFSGVKRQWPALAVLVAVACGSDPAAPVTKRPDSTPTALELVVRVLDVGQGDASIITNGKSTVIIDGGPSAATFGAWLDRFGVNGDTIDAVILSHEHADHYRGLQELFRTTRSIVVRRFFENQNPSSADGLGELRDSAAARASRNQTELRDTDNPCGNLVFKCILLLDGGAKIEVVRPLPTDDNPNNRSALVKVIGPDSASFTMLLAGDAERSEIDYFDRVEYPLDPGMQVTVLKANHHGSCNGITRRYLDAVRPSLVVMSVGATNTFGHVHEQAKSLLRERSIPWLRTDVNGMLEFRTPGTASGGYAVFTERDGLSRSGNADATASAATCPPL